MCLCVSSHVRAKSDCTPWTSRLAGKVAERWPLRVNLEYAFPDTSIVPQEGGCLFREAWEPFPHHPDSPDEKRGCKVQGC